MSVTRQQNGICFGLLMVAVPIEQLEHSDGADQLTFTEPTIPLVKLVEWTVQRYRYVPAESNTRT